IASAASCRAELPRPADPARICEARVTLDGASVPCDARDGFRLSGETTIELAGATCDRFREGGHTLRASFPCGVLR
ncbi:MAG: hypothetical protein M3Y87_17430, partial [Myxococcota bacterium]|nr:hypothetical protein [Myxococcota bacterium]